MKFTDFKKYLDLRKYFSLNISAILGFYYEYLTFQYTHTNFPPPVSYGEGPMASPEESEWIDKLFTIEFIIVLLMFLFIFELVLKILINLLQKKYFNKQPKEKISKPKSKTFLFFEIIYSILFVIGNIPLFHTFLVFILPWN